MKKFILGITLLTSFASFGATVESFTTMGLKKLMESGGVTQDSFTFDTVREFFWSRGDKFPEEKKLVDITIMIEPVMPQTSARMRSNSLYTVTNEARDQAWRIISKLDALNEMELRDGVTYNILAGTLTKKFTEYGVGEKPDIIEIASILNRMAIINY